MINIGIIGGGASGLFFANYLEYLIYNDINLESLKNDVKITIFERLEKVGKKILVTGNGRCNLTNLHVDKTRYNNPEFVAPALKKMDPKRLINYFESIGLCTYSDSEGRVYPYSDSANSVLDVLRINSKRYGILEKINSDVKKISYKDNKYTIETNRQERFSVDILLLATGGAASPVHGSNGSGYTLAKMLKHKVTSIEPGLTQLLVDPNEVKALNGIKSHVVISLFDKKKKCYVYKNEGELLFKQDSLSGIVSFETSSFISRNPANYEIVLDLMSEYSTDQLFNILMNRITIFENEEVLNLFTGIFNKMLGMQILKKSKVFLNSKCSDLKESDIFRIIHLVKEYHIPFKKVSSLDKAQVTVGGVDLNEVNNETMESKLSPNFYLIGEVLDIDGDCGGFNLHFAFASATLAANAILKKLLKGSIFYE